MAVIDEPHRLRNSKEVGPYLGLVPKQWQSSETDRLGHIARHGSGVVRSLGGSELGWVALQPVDRDTYQRVKRGSKARRKIAIVAVARRLSIRCWAMRDGTPWRDALPTLESAGVGKKTVIAEVRTKGVRITLLV